MDFFLFSCCSLIWIPVIWHFVCTEVCLYALSTQGRVVGVVD